LPRPRSVAGITATSERRCWRRPLVWAGQWPRFQRSSLCACERWRRNENEPAPPPPKVGPKIQKISLSARSPAAPPASCTAQAERSSALLNRLEAAPAPLIFSTHSPAQRPHASPKIWGASLYPKPTPPPPRSGSERERWQQRPVSRSVGLLTHSPPSTVDSINAARQDFVAATCSVGPFVGPPRLVCSPGGCGDALLGHSS